MNLKGTPFYVSNTNTLVGVGCNITALLTNVKPNIVGCKSSCSKNYHTLTKDYLAVVACNRNRKNCGFHETGRCDGIRCCKTDMPEVIQQIVDVRIDSTTTTGDCKVAFITDDAYFLSNRSDPQRLHAKRYSTVELGWFIHTANRSFVKSLECSNIKYYDSRAKVSDFGTSRSVTVDHTHLTTVVSGTVGYVDPEYFQSSQFTDKSDVYSFGVVLVELITGEKSISFFRSQENRTLATYFIMAMKENKLFDIIDTRIKDGCMLNQVTATAKFARKCLNLKGRKRPSMREVSMELENIRSSLGDMQQHEHVSENEEEEEKDKRVVEDIIGEESRNDVVVTAPASQYNIAAASSSSWSDVEPLFPFQTR